MTIKMKKKILPMDENRLFSFSISEKCNLSAALHLLQWAFNHYACSSICFRKKLICLCFQKYSNKETDKWDSAVYFMQNKWTERPIAQENCFQLSVIKCSSTLTTEEYGLYVWVTSKDFQHLNLPHTTTSFS